MMGQGFADSVGTRDGCLVLIIGAMLFMAGLVIGATLL